jgi:hypothetical protein
MMRFNIVLVSLILVATAAAARPGSTPKRPLAPPSQAPVTIDLSTLHLHLFHAPEATDDSAAAAKDTDRQQDWSQPNLANPLDMGPLHAEIGTVDNPWGSLSNYQSQLGGSAWLDQSNKSRAAKLLFVWPTDK